MFAHKCRNSNSRGHLCLQGISCSLGNRYSMYVLWRCSNECLSWFQLIFAHFLFGNGIIVARTSRRFAPFINYQRMNGLFHIKTKVRGLLLGRHRAEFLEIGWHTLPLFFSRWAWAFDMEMLLFSSNALRNMLCVKSFQLSTLPKLGKCHAGEGVEEVYHWQLQSR